MPSVTEYPVPRSKWVQSAEACAACGKRFSFFMTKGNCTCCGKLFCSSCLPEECLLSPMGFPTRVCLNCFQLMQEMRRGQQEPSQGRAGVAATGTTDPFSSSSAAAVPNARLDALEKEVERVKSLASQLRDENTTLVDLLAVKDGYIAELTGDRVGEADISHNACDGRSAEKTRRNSKGNQARPDELYPFRDEKGSQASTQPQPSDAAAASAAVDTEKQAEWEREATALRRAAREHEQIAAQRLEEMVELRTVTAATKAKSEEQLRLLTAQLQSEKEKHALLHEKYEKAIAQATIWEGEVKALQASEVSRLAADARQSEELTQLRAAVGAAHRERGEAQKLLQQQQHLLSERDAEHTAAAEKEEILASIRQELKTSKETVEQLREDLRLSQGEAQRLQLEVEKSKSETESRLPDDSRQLNGETSVVAEQSQRHQEANQCRRSDLLEKQRLIKAVQSRSRNAASAVRTALGDLRQRLAETKETYQKTRLSWQTSLEELHSTFERWEQQRQSEAAAATEHRATAGGAVANGKHHPPSRWARHTIVQELLYPEVTELDVSTIAPLSGLERWEFDTKGEAQRANKIDLLVRVGHQIAQDWRLFPDRSAQQRWVCWLDTVQANYRKNPYHNKVHAADVLQGVYALVRQCPGLLEHMTMMEKRAVLFAAAAHDVRHPGRSEMFLKNTFDATYLNYNGQQVLEQMHTASAFRLLETPALDFTAADMSDTEALDFHSLVVSLIGGTFMGRHNALMEQWARPLREGKGYDLQVAVDRHQVLSMLMHAADIGAQSRGVSVALKWLDIVEEMCLQGDEELALKIPQSPGTSRSANVERGQLFFMEMFVVPLFDLIHQLFPDVAVPLRNLGVMHAHYCAKLGESRPFPPPVEYRKKATAASTAGAARPDEMQESEAKVARQEKAVQGAVARLREATAAVAQREALIAEKEAKLVAWEAACASSHREEEAAAHQTEEDLLRATNLVVSREAEVQRKALGLEKFARELEERETLLSNLSSELTTVAEKVNRRRRQLRYRELRVRSREDVRDSDAKIGMAPAAVLRNPLVRGAAPPRVHSAPASSPTLASTDIIHLEGALDKLRSALYSL